MHDDIMHLIVLSIHVLYKIQVQTTLQAYLDYDDANKCTNAHNPIVSVGYFNARYHAN